MSLLGLLNSDLLQANFKKFVERKGKIIRAFR